MNSKPIQLVDGIPIGADDQLKKELFSEIFKNDAILTALIRIPMDKGGLIFCRDSDDLRMHHCWYPPENGVCRGTLTIHSNKKVKIYKISRVVYNSIGEKREIEILVDAEQVDSMR